MLVRMAESGLDQRYSACLNPTVDNLFYICISLSIAKNIKHKYEEKKGPFLVEKFTSWYALKI